MPEPLRTDPAITFGRENIIFIPTIAAAATLAPTVAEATSASGLDITLAAFDEAVMLNGSTERVSPDPRYGDTAEYETIGKTKYEGGECVLAWQPQAAPATNGKKAWATFPEGTTGFFAKREDIEQATDIVAGVRLSWVMPVKFGPRIPTKKGSGAQAQAAFKTTYAVTGKPKTDVVVLA